MSHSKQQEKFVAALQQKANFDADYWSYKRMGQRPGLHGLIRYPAMMVPRMLSDILDAAEFAIPDIQSVFDPFVGSGTVMLESLRRGLNFEGIDINPLAILVCRAKLLSLAHETVRARIHRLLLHIHADRSKAINVSFPGRDKWFTRQACIDLSRIRRAIIDQNNKDLRFFLWTILAETIRQTSLSRESTYKLHIRPPIEQGKIESPLSCFQRLSLNAIERYSYEARDPLYLAGRRRARNKARLSCGDVRQVKSEQKSQLLITSPPYGDNRSTITYGQFSYLALKWISEEDIEGDARLRESAYRIDSASLGGSSRAYAARAKIALDMSRSFKAFYKQLQSLGRPELEAKAASFTADLCDATSAALSRLLPGGMAIWTLGERRIGGIPVPLVKICCELNQNFGLTPLTQITRRIQSKRMPHKNSQGATMANETILIMQKI